MNVGKMRHEITLQKPQAVVDAGGGRDITWLTVENIHGEVKPLRSHEQLHAMALQNPITHRVTIRHRTDLKPNWRLIYDGRTFSIISSVDPTERKDHLVLSVQEGLPV